MARPKKEIIPTKKCLHCGMDLEYKLFYKLINNSNIYMRNNNHIPVCKNLIAMNPVTKSVKCPKKPEKNTRVLTLDEQERFLTAAKESINYNHFLFILQTGVRSSELRGLKWSDIDFENSIIHIRRNVTHDSNNNRFITGELKTSSGKRDIPMTQTAYDLLMDIKRQQEVKKQGYSFLCSKIQFKTVILLL